MKKTGGCYNSFLKTVAFLLALVFLLLLTASILSIVGLVELDAYAKTREALLVDELGSIARSMANDIGDYLAQENLEPMWQGYQVSRYDIRQLFEEPESTNLRFTIFGSDGKPIHSTYQNEAYICAEEMVIHPCFYREITHKETYLDGSTVRVSEWSDIDQQMLDTQWTVRCYVLEDMRQNDLFQSAHQLINLAYTMRWWVVVFLVVGLLGSICTVVYLLNAAGRRSGREGVTPNLLDRIPTDLYIACLIGLCALGCVLFFELFYYLSGLYWSGSVQILVILALVGLAAGIATLILGGILSVVARLKLGGGYIWRRTVCFWVLRLCWRVVKWCWAWVKRGLRCLGRVFRLLPLIWQWLVLGGGLLFVILLSILGQNFTLLMLCGLAWLSLTVYLAVSFGQLQRSIHAMVTGRLESRVPADRLHGSFRQMALDINALGAGAELEVERRMRSERMKTELITNVSHDIKTPLTSIVSYVDLLQKAETEQQRQAYLEVLARQAQRLKKLTEDLVEMSKASSGNLTANVEKTNIVELVNQALGEYDEKMERSALIIVKKLPEMEIYAQADGRLFWRVMDNILGNCVKYAMPNTRIYADVNTTSDSVTVSVKNISKEPLNITAEELMERFVRGDRSRNTEGSGLGLNIAKTLMELQGGALTLQVDGDLFKATLTLKRFDPQS